MPQHGFTNTDFDKSFLTGDNILGQTSVGTGLDINFGNTFTPEFGNSSLDVNSKFGFNPSGGTKGFNFGALSAGIQGVGSLANAFAAYKQYQLGKDKLAQNKKAFNLNFENQAKVTNAEIDDRERRRAFERSDITGDLDAISAAAEASAAPRRVNGRGI